MWSLKRAQAKVDDARLTTDTALSQYRNSSLCKKKEKKMLSSKDFKWNSRSASCQTMSMITKLSTIFETGADFGGFYITYSISQFFRQNVQRHPNMTSINKTLFTSLKHKSSDITYDMSHAL